METLNADEAAYEASCQRSVTQLDNAVEQLGWAFRLRYLGTTCYGIGTLRSLLLAEAAEEGTMRGVKPMALALGSECFNPPGGVVFKEVP